MAQGEVVDERAREPVLSPVDRVSEMLFGLFMALSIVGAVSVAQSGEGQIRAMLIAALGCNLAWGFVDAVMYLVRTVSDRGSSLSLVRSVRAAPDAQSGRRLIEKALSRGAAHFVSAAEIEAIRARMVALAALPERPQLHGEDLRAALAIFLWVMVSTFPVVIPFVVFSDVMTAKNVAHAISLVLFFVGGLALGRYAGYGSWKAGFLMAGLGTLLVVAIRALGG